VRGLDGQDAGDRKLDIRAEPAEYELAQGGSASSRRTLTPTPIRTATDTQLKKDYLAGIGDSLDLVVVGAYHGKGKRTAVYGAFLLACYDPDSENFQTICKIGTGFTEEVLTQFYELLQPLEIASVRGDVEVGGAKPDVWFEPKVVWEVLTADLSLSPVYTAGHGLVSGDY
jgi:ATP-dependent DNA ligase